ncbi:hypothetical protein EVG20_g2948 [Dentipellis fragilis]|uniref:Uncharacterized protein n=1 Tax=Dentipellis fragilis TaxID=205917 RepID=A0A4Y9Z640_9AGAM|nr:hypothetical protein EVG20_g2948 [Dentipellis fragilis]
MNAWAPQEAGLREILQTIHESLDTENAAVQRNITHVSNPPSSAAATIRPSCSPAPPPAPAPAPRRN